MILTKLQLCLLLSAALIAPLSAVTLQACTECLVKIPQAFFCGVSPSSECSWDSCIVNSTVFDFDACDDACLDCFDDVLTCFDECTPSCLNNTVNDYYNCVVSAPWIQCGGPCYNEYKDVNITDSLEGLFDDALQPPGCTLDDLMTGNINILQSGIDCLFPSWPTCPAVQQDIVQPTCDATSCCSTCHGELAAMETCVYNWMAGTSCDFTCAANRFLNEDFISAGATTTQHDDQRLLDTTVTAPAFEEECRVQLSRDAVADPVNAVSNFVTCITSQTLEEATEESLALENQPGDDDDDDNNNAGDDDDDDDDGTTSLAVRNKHEVLVVSASMTIVAAISSFFFAL